MAILRWTPAAESDLYDIHFYIGTTNRSPAAADHLIDTIRDKCHLHAIQPEMGESRPEFGVGLRTFSVGSYVVIYLPFFGGIEVVRVFHGRRDYPNLFRS